jgi:uncharacterized membrane protein
VAAFGGSWVFVFVFATLIAGWIILNAAQYVFRPFDPFPFIFLNLILQCIAAFQAPVIMMSQNREALKDRLKAEIEYRVNLKAEIQIQTLHIKIDELRATEFRRITEKQSALEEAVNRQSAILSRIDQAWERSSASRTRKPD